MSAISLGIVFVALMLASFGLGYCCAKMDEAHRRLQEAIDNLERNLRK